MGKKQQHRLTVRVARAEAGRPTIVLAIPNWPDLLALDNGILYLNAYNISLCLHSAAAEMNWKPHGYHNAGHV